ncbi:hypothetical protein ACET3X_002106 [Alternaria dauci]|uniref:Uncharacterized protein n=1 Tax=Alternaria dauci TaxID=48095 RepID=A0ABR3V0H5_9PLEO
MAALKQAQCRDCIHSPKVEHLVIIASFPPSRSVLIATTCVDTFELTFTCDFRLIVCDSAHNPTHTHYLSPPGMSYKTHKHEITTAEDIDMARLSAPANKTPKTDRKSNRFRDIFKHRPGSSASSSPATLEKLSPPGRVSPLLSPIMPPGFQQVRLLPSERSSLSSQRPTEFEARDMNAESTVSTARKRSSNSEPTTRSADAPTLGKLKDEHQVIEQGSFTQSMKRVLSQHPGENADGETAKAGLTMGEDLPPQDLTYNKNNSSRTNDSIDSHRSYSAQPHDIDAIKTIETSGSMEERETSLLLEPVNKHGTDTMLSQNEGRSSHCNSLAPNILDGDSSLNKKIRAYITSKIAEALVEHDRTHADQGDATVNPPIHVTIKIDAAGLAEATKLRTSITGDNKAVTHNGPSSMGPLKITSAQLARNAQLAIMAFYAVTLLGASLLGPKTLLLTVWRMAIMLTLYAVVLRQLNWILDLERDTFLSPVFFTASVAKGIGEQLLVRTRVMTVAVFADILKYVVHGIGVQVRTE